MVINGANERFKDEMVYTPIKKVFDFEKRIFSRFLEIICLKTKAFGLFGLLYQPQRLVSISGISSWLFRK